MLCCGQAWSASVVDTLRPVGDRAMGSGHTWTVYPSGNLWDAYDDTTANEDVNYVHNISVGSSQHMGWYHTDFSGGDNIDSVTLLIRDKSSATSGTKELIFGRMWYYETFWNWCTNDDGTDTINVGSSYTDSFITWTNDPYDGNSWTQSGLNSTSRAWVISNKSVGTMQDSFGCTSAPSYRTPSTNYIALFRWQADFTGTVDTLEMLYDDGNNVSDVRLAIYSDSGASPGYPYQLLDSTAVHDVSDGKNRVPLVDAGVSIVNGTYYWLCHRVSATWDTTKYETSGTNRYESMNYSLQWPTTIPSGYHPTDTKDCLQAIASKPADNRITQSFIVVYYQTAVVGKRGTNILSGGIVK